MYNVKKRISKILAVAVAVTSLFSTGTINIAYAETFMDGYFVAATNDDGTLTITNYNGGYNDDTEGYTVLEIPSEINGKTVTAIKEKAFSAYYDSKAGEYEPDEVPCSIEEIIIPDTVKSVGDYAFYGTNSVKKFTFSKNLESIGHDAFAETKWYNSELAATVDHLVINGIIIGSNKKTGTLIIPEGIKKIAPYVFLDATGLTSVTFPNSLTEIGEYAFAGCESLATINNLSAVKVVGYGAFQGTKYESQVTTNGQTTTTTKKQITIKPTTKTETTTEKDTTTEKETTTGNDVTTKKESENQTTATERLTEPETTAPSTVQIDLSKASIVISRKSYTYTGKKIMPKVTVKVDGKVVSKTNYTVSYKNNIKCGKAIITVKGKNNAIKSRQKAFIITKKSIRAKDMKIIMAAKVRLRGKAVKPNVVIKFGTRKLRKTDYRVVYRNNKKVGRATATITGRGNFTGSITKRFRIVK